MESLDTLAASTIRDFDGAGTVHSFTPEELASLSVELFSISMEVLQQRLQQSKRRCTRHTEYKSALTVIVNVLHRVLLGCLLQGLTAREARNVASLRGSYRAERTRTARELHDQLSHDVGLAIRRLELFDMYRDRSPEHAESHFRRAMAALHDGREDIRRIAYGLRIHDRVASLERALYDYVDTVDRCSVDLRTTVHGNEDHLPEHIRSEMFVLIREALSNAITNARAKTIIATVTITAEQVFAVVEDDGIGFGPDGAAVHRRESGLASLRERSALLGGECRLHSRPGHGTRIEMRAPLTGSVTDVGSE
ncbi:hypothetical protein GCM10022402_30610 [Salinactinospora qingdaonensis]|uniref:Histidine kinase/HSP90-like ATPase domain-containing protein n=2 Tax=Salinactinospora qingdaonensis TaxID=702744 RepID=A0ABP7FV95_9ACTN